MKQFNDVNHAYNLPDCYDKTPIKKRADGTYEGSNNSKILETERLSVNMLCTDIQTIDEILDVDKATGITLDLYGEMLNQPRGTATDPQYRLMLKSKVAQSLTSGTFPSVLNALYQAFGCDPSEIVIYETNTPCTVKVEGVPLGVIAKAGLSTAQTAQIIERLMPAGVAVETLSFEGTFEFSATEEDMHIDGDTKGYTDTEENMNVENAIGGYLGAIYEGENQELPL